MQQVGVSSFKALCKAAGVSERQVKQLRQGKADQMQVVSLHKLSQALGLSLAELVATFSDLSMAERASSDLAASRSPRSPSMKSEDAGLNELQQEYQRLQGQLAQQKTELWQEFQQATLQTLESCLIFLPTAAYQAQQNPELPATRLLPLMRPIDQLLKDWGVEAIAPVGTELPFEPHLHQLMEGTAQPGDRVKVRYTGYRQGEKLLYRAKVSPVKG
jgi:molecular chaperone GrpE (heat shock protein)